MLYTTYVPHLTYASDAIFYTSSHMQPLNVALDDSIWRFFTLNRWGNVGYLRLSLGYTSLLEIFENRSRKFLKQVSLLGNSTLEFLQKLHLQRNSEWLDFLSPTFTNFWIFHIFYSSCMLLRALLLMTN